MDLLIKMGGLIAQAGKMLWAIAYEFPLISGAVAVVVAVAIIYLIVGR